MDNNCPGDSVPANECDSTNCKQQDYIEQHADARHKQYNVIGMEPALFLIFFAITVSGTVFQNQIIYETCIYHFNYNASDCAMLGKQNSSKFIQTMESIIQPYVTKIFLTQTMIKTIIPVLLSFLIGPWSDKFGRIPITLSSIFGYCLHFMLILILTYISTYIGEISPWLYIVAFIPLTIFGGNCGLFVGIFCYVSDTSHMKNRALKMAIMEASLFAGLVAGLLVASYLSQITSQQTIYIISVLASVIALIYVAWFVEESIVSPHNIKGFDKFLAIFDFGNASKMFTVCLKKRDNWNRCIIWVAMLAITATVFSMEGDLAVFYLSIRERFAWTIKQYNFYNTINILVQIFGNVAGLLFFRKLLHTPESIVGAIGFLSCCCCNFILGITTQTWHLWIATAFAALKGVATPMCRAILANTVDIKEIGAVYSFTASIENLTPLAAAPLYNIVYVATLNTNPGAFSFISAGIFAGCTVLLIFIYVIQKRYQNVNYQAIQHID